jgi:acetyl esterase/lipase
MSLRLALTRAVLLALPWTSCTAVAPPSEPTAAVAPGARAESTAPTDPAVHVYARVDGVDLEAHVFAPPPGGARAQRPAIVLFHGGGWSIGEPAWGYARARHFAERGLVAVAAQYRLSDQKAVTPLEAMADARAVIRWMRREADALGIDPARVAAYGWSAGGHLAASAAIFDELDPDQPLSSSPNALVLVSPAVSLASDKWVQGLLLGRVDVRAISPADHVRAGLPPTLVLQGDVGTVTPLAGAQLFCDRMRAAGNACELHVYSGYGHLFTPAGVRDDEMPKADPAIAADALGRADEFLRSLGFSD